MPQKNVKKNPRKKSGQTKAREKAPAEAILPPAAAAVLSVAGMMLLLPVFWSGLKKTAVFPAAVLEHRAAVEACAEKEGIPGSTDELLAIMTVESGGEAEDVMQSSESLGFAPDTLDSESSIAQGCRNYASLLRAAKRKKTDRASVYQAYNYGPGYLDFVAKNGGVHTRELSERFALQQSEGRKKTYTNPVAVEANGGWRYAYGNMFYAELVSGLMEERRREMEPGMLSKLLILLSAAEAGFLCFAAVFRTEGSFSLGLFGVSAADLKRRTGIAQLIRSRGFPDGLAAVLLIYGLYLSSCPAEFCGAVLLALAAGGVYSGLSDRPALFLVRGLLPLAAFLSLLAGVPAQGV